MGDFHSSWLIVTVRNVAARRMDLEPRSIYYAGMNRASPILLFAFLALFAVSNIVQAMNANSMALEMAMVDGNAMAMDGCQNCPMDGAVETVLCELDCTAPAVFVLTKAVSFHGAVFVFRQERPLGMLEPDSLLAPPDPFPPRSLI